MTTWTARLSNERKRLALWFTIQGIDRVFKETPTINCSTILGETRPESAAIIAGSIEEGESRIDMEKLCQVGGSFRARLVQQRGSTILTALFVPRKRKTTFLTTSCSKTDATIAVGSTSAFAAPGTFFIGNECVAFTGLTPTTFTGCTRGKYGSRAQRHEGTSTDGTGIYAAAPAWLGRRISLYGSFLKDDGTTSAALTTQLGTFALDEPPKYLGDNQWELSAGPLADEYASRKLYVGMKEVGATAIYLASPTDEALTVEVDDASQFVPSAGGFFSHALVKLPNGFALIGRVTSKDTVSIPNLITVIPTPGFLDPPVTRTTAEQSSRSSTSGSKPGLLASSAKHIAIIGGTIGAPVLEALTSIVGDAANGAQDLLPGKEALFWGDRPWRMGAGIDQADIDVASFNNSISTLWYYFLDDVITVQDIMREWCLMADRLWYVKANGQITTSPATNIKGTTVLTIDKTVLAAGTTPEIVDDESTIFPLLRVRGNYSMVTREFLYDAVTYDRELAQRYPQREQEKVIALKSLGVDKIAETFPQRFVRPNPKSSGEIEQLSRRWQLADGRGRLVVRAKCKLKGLLASLGDIVTIGFDGPDLEGGNINGRDARVIGRRPRYNDGQVDLELHLMDKVFVVAPSAVVTALSTTSIANDTLTLSTTSPDASGATPEQDFPVGSQVRFWDVSAGTSQVLTVAAILAGNKLRFTAGVAGAIEANRDWLTWNTLATNAGLTSPSGYGESDLLYMMPNSGTAAAGVTRRLR